ncbi:MAG: arginase family protein [Armatimonadetes bacterium]|nr:arginase family protein [Armatimonadota bacterium]CUU35276.1 agmatinase [Armatimonadetes bacterium DC]
MLPFAGVATFLRAPHRPLNESWQAEVGVLGVPWDGAVGYRPGARFAPQALRLASLRYPLSEQGYYHPLHGYRLQGVRVVDAGDVDTPPMDYETAFARITESARLLRQRVKLPLFLGGDHSITFPLLRAFDDVPDLHVVQIDAHLDFTDERDGVRYSNSSPFRRAVEALPNLTHITTVGLRGVRFDPEAVQAAQARGHTLVFREALREGHSLPLPSGKPVYLSVDADALDPAVLPAVNSPEPDGLSFHEAARVIAETIRNNTLVGVDFVELTPTLDPTQNSALIAVRLLLEVLIARFG